MATVETENREHYLADIEAFQALDAPDWIREIRRGGAERFDETTYPHYKQEEWRYTDVKPVIQTPFRLAPEDAAAPDDKLLRSHLYAETDWPQLVFVDGAYRADLSHTATLPEGVIVGSLAQAVADGNPAARQHLNQLAEPTNAFATLNTAFLNDGLFVFVPKSTKLETPVHALYLSTGSDGVAAYSRALVVLDESAEADLIETFVGPDGDAHYLNNAVSEMIVGDNARLRRHKIVAEGSGSSHLATTHVREGRDARLASFNVTVSGRIVRNELRVVLRGAGANCDLSGLYLNDGDRLIDNPLYVEHAASNCYSRMAYKGVLDGTSRSVFTGKVFVQPGAQKTDSDQINNNLLRSDDAVIDTKPQLEIFADDVKCTHGATIGGFPKELLFYFQSRGMSPAMADAILTYGFAAEIVDAIEIGPLHDRLDTYVFDKFRPQ